MNVNVFNCDDFAFTCNPFRRRVKKNTDTTIREDLANNSFIEYPLENFQPLNLASETISEIFIHDHTMSYMYVKSKKLKIFGKSEKEIIGLHPNSTLPPDIYNVLESIFNNTKNTHIHQQNSFFWLNQVAILDSFPIVDKNKKFLGLLIIQREMDKHQIV